LSVSWSTRGAWECRGQGSPGLADTAWVTEDFVLPPTRPAGNPFTFDLSTVPTGTHTLTLQCQNGPATSLRQVSRTLVVTEVTSGDCTGRTSPRGMRRDTTLSRDNRSDKTEIWTDLWGTVGNIVTFPNGKTGSPITFRTSRDQYGQIDFTTVDLQPGAVGQWTATEPTGDRSGPYLVSISECPGDFGVAVEPACRKVLVPGSPFNRIRWAEASVAASGRCPLERDKQYFLNVVPTTTVPADQNVDWICNGQRPTACDITLTHRLE
ncbi:MAG: hypothetical protein ACNA7E_10395, partial [Wenzhouxiangellaceae bacterium]